MGKNQNTTDRGRNVRHGFEAGHRNQGESAVAIGEGAGRTSQGANAVAIGKNAGYNTQGVNSVAIGLFTGQSAQGDNSIAMGTYDAYSSQGDNCIAIGGASGQSSQGDFSIAIGTSSGRVIQGKYSIAIGADAGRDTQAEYSIAIGHLAARNFQSNNSIVLNATGNVLDASNVDAFYVKPIRFLDTLSANVLTYHAESGEIIDSNAITFRAGSTLVGINNSNPKNLLDVGQCLSVDARGSTTNTLTVRGGVIAEGNLNVCNNLFVDALTGFVGICNMNPKNMLDVGDCISVHSDGTPHVLTVRGDMSANTFTVNKDLIITGNLHVHGTETIMNTEKLLIKDPIIELANNITDADQDVGIIMRRPGTDPSVFIGYHNHTNGKGLSIGHTTSDIHSINLDVAESNSLPVYIHGSLTVGHTVNTVSNVVEVTGNLNATNFLFGSNVIAHNTLKVGEVLTIDKEASNVVEVRGNLNATNFLLGSNVIAHNTLKVGEVLTIDKEASNVVEVRGNLNATNFLLGSNVIAHNTLKVGEVLTIDEDIQLIGSTTLKFNDGKFQAYHDGNDMTFVNIKGDFNYRVEGGDVNISVGDGHNVNVKRTGSDALPLLVADPTKDVVTMSGALKVAKVLTIDKDASNVVEVIGNLNATNFLFGSNVIAHNTLKVAKVLTIDKDASNVVEVIGNLNATNFLFGSNVIAHNTLKVAKVLTIDKEASNVVEVTGNLNATSFLFGSNVIAHNTLKVGEVLTIDKEASNVVDVRGNLNATSFLFGSNVIAHNTLKVGEVLTIDKDASNVVEVTGNLNATSFLFGSNVIAHNTLKVAKVLTIDKDASNVVEVRGGVYISGILTAHDIVVANLHVHGTTTTIHTEKLEVKDPIIGLGSGGGADTLGLLMEISATRGSNVFAGYHEEKYQIGFTSDGIHDTELRLTGSIPVQINGSLNVVGNISGTSSNIGYNTTASGTYSHAEGANTTASGYASHAEGFETTASGYASHTEGYDTTASGKYSHAEGYKTVASSTYFPSHAEGGSTLASGPFSHAEGNETQASGSTSHAEGYATTASDSYSHAEGNETTARGFASHAEGSSTEASGKYSHAGGLNTIASEDAQYVVGQNNALVTDGLFIVGVGTNSTTRKNGLVVTKTGIVTVGELNVGVNTVIDSNRKITGSSLNVGGNIAGTSLNVGGIITAKSFKFDGGQIMSLYDGDTTFINFNNGRFGGSVRAARYEDINGNRIIDSDRNIYAKSLDVGDTTVIDSARNIFAKSFKFDGGQIMSLYDGDTTFINIGNGRFDGSVRAARYEDIYGNWIIDSDRNIFAKSLDVGDTTVIDSARNIFAKSFKFDGGQIMSLYDGDTTFINFNNGRFGGSVRAARYEDIDGNRIIDSFRNIYANSLHAGGINVIDSDRNIFAKSLYVGGTAVIDSDRNIFAKSLNVDGLTTVGELLTGSHVRIPYGGILGIGTNGAGMSKFSISCTANQELLFSHYSAGYGSIFFRNDFNAGTTGNPNYTGSTRIYIDGEVYVNTVFNNSDDRLKHNEEPVIDALSTLNKLKLQKYDKTNVMMDADYRGDLSNVTHHTEIGFIAQEVKEIPELAHVVHEPRSESDPYSVNYNDIHNLGIQGIQELYAKYKDLLVRVAALEAK
jgi:hypothetical protein